MTIGRIFALPLIGLVRFYQVAIGPLLPKVCRFEPSCSMYMLEALKLHGPFKGTWMGLCRIGRCHPWGGQGYDPVPAKGHKRGCAHDHEEPQKTVPLPDRGQTE